MLYSGLGYGSTDQLLLQAGWISFAPIGNLFNALIIDKVGRVKLLGKQCILFITPRMPADHLQLRECLATFLPLLEKL